jgi:hypothetical protein
MTGGLRTPMIKRLKRLKNNVNKYMADIRPDRLTTCHSDRKSVVSRRPSVVTWFREELAQVTKSYMDYSLTITQDVCG